VTKDSSSFGVTNCHCIGVMQKKQGKVFVVTLCADSWFLDE